MKTSEQSIMQVALGYLDLKQSGSVFRINSLSGHLISCLSSHDMILIHS